MLRQGRLDYVIMVIVSPGDLEKPDPSREIYVHRGDLHLLPQNSMISPWHNTYEWYAHYGTPSQAFGVSIVPGLAIMSSMFHGVPGVMPGWMQ